MCFRTTNHLWNINLEKEKTNNKLKKSGVQIAVAAPTSDKPFNPLKQDIRFNKQKSAFAQLLVDSNHSISNISDGLKVLHVHKNNALEEFKIYELFHNSECENRAVIVLICCVFL